MSYNSDGDDINHSYVGIEFQEEDGGGVALVHSGWLTPRKKEVHWPPLKSSDRFNKAVKNGVAPSDNWSVYKVSRFFFECDNYEKACKKVKLLEVTSDVQTSDTEGKKRKRLATRRLYDSSESDEEGFSQLPRPPKIRVEKKRNLDKSSQESLINRIEVISPKLVTTPLQESSCNRVLTPSVRTASSSIGTTPTSTTLTDFELKQLQLLAYIKEQNNQIIAKLDLLCSSKESTPAYTAEPDDLPVTLPVDDEESLRKLENYLATETALSQLMLSLSSLGGYGLISITNTILRKLMTNALACSYSFLGKRDKKPFCSLRIKKAAHDAVKTNSPNAKDFDIEAAMKLWLKHAPQRYRNDKRIVNSNIDEVDNN